MGLQVSPTTVSPLHALKCMPSYTGVKMSETISMQATGILVFCWSTVTL